MPKKKKTQKKQNAFHGRKGNFSKKENSIKVHSIAQVDDYMFCALPIPAEDDSGIAYAFTWLYAKNRSIEPLESLPNRIRSLSDLMFTHLNLAPNFLDAQIAALEALVTDPRALLGKHPNHTDVQLLIDGVYLSMADFAPEIDVLDLRNQLIALSLYVDNLDEYYERNNLIEHLEEKIEDWDNRHNSVLSTSDGEEYFDSGDYVEDFLDEICLNLPTGTHHLCVSNDHGILSIEVTRNAGITWEDSDDLEEDYHSPNVIEGKYFGKAGTNIPVGLLSKETNIADYSLPSWGTHAFSEDEDMLDQLEELNEDEDMLDDDILLPYEYDGDEELFTILAIYAFVNGGGLTVRTSIPKVMPDGTPRYNVYGYMLGKGKISPLSEQDIFSAYCTDNVAGEPLPPEYGVNYVVAPENNFT